MARKQRKDGWWYPWIFVGGMLVVVIVNGIMIRFAVTTFTGLETEDHYLKGLAYDQAIQGAREQAKLGWKVDVSYVADPPRDGQRVGVLSTTLMDAEGKPLTALKVRAVVTRPVKAGMDQELDLPVDAKVEGRYSSQILLPHPGQWDVRVLAEHEGQVYQHVRRIMVP